MHRHSGIAYMTPHSVHYGHAQALLVTCQAALDAAFLAHPTRFKNKRPSTHPMPTAVWINPPPMETTSTIQQPQPCTVNL